MLILDILTAILVGKPRVPQPVIRKPKDDAQRLREDMERWANDVNYGATKAVAEIEGTQNEA